MDDREKSTLLGCLLQICSPEKVILFGTKHGLSSGQLKVVSLCIIVPQCDKNALLRRLYLELPLDFQVNIQLYTHQEWADLTEDPDSHASWIAKKGSVIYEP